jgi:hypothetical protein
MNPWVVSFPQLFARLFANEQKCTQVHTIEPCEPLSKGSGKSTGCGKLYQGLDGPWAPWQGPSEPWVHLMTTRGAERQLQRQEMCTLGSSGTVPDIQDSESVDGSGRVTAMELERQPNCKGLHEDCWEAWVSPQHLSLATHSCPALCSFAFQHFSHPWSNTVWNYSDCDYVNNSEDLKFYAVVRQKLLATSSTPPERRIHPLSSKSVLYTPLIQHFRAVHYLCLSHWVVMWSTGHSMVTTFHSLTKGPKAQK